MTEERRVNRRIWMSCILTIVVLFGLGLARHALGSQRVRVDRGPVGERIVARAAVVPSTDVVHVYAGADGHVVRLTARAGDEVRVGEVLAELDGAGKTHKVSAPVAGVVLERRAEIGDYVRTAEHGALEPLMVLADPTHTELRIEVEEADATRLRPGLPIVVRQPGLSGAAASQPAARGRIERLSARLEPRLIGADDARLRAGGLVRVAFASWDGEQLGWPLGARVEVSIDLGNPVAAARLPRDAVSVREGKTVVERPHALGLWSRETRVDVVRVDPIFAEIRGLAVGSEVLIPGS